MIEAAIFYSFSRCCDKVHDTTEELMMRTVQWTLITFLLCKFLDVVSVQLGIITQIDKSDRTYISFLLSLFSFGEIRKCLNHCTFQNTNLVKQVLANLFSAQYVHSLKLSQGVQVKYIRYSINNYYNYFNINLFSF